VDALTSSGQLDATTAGTARATGGDTLLDLRGHLHEGLLYVGGVLGGGLQEGDAQAIGELLGDTGVDGLLDDEIALVADEELVHRVGGVLVNLLEPGLDVVEAFHIGDVVDDDDTVGTTVVAAGDGTESLLTGGIPNLQLDGLSLELHGADFEVNANGGDVALSVGIVGETEQEAGLANTGVADQQQLEEVIVVSAHILF